MGGRAGVTDAVNDCVGVGQRLAAAVDVRVANCRPKHDAVAVADSRCDTDVVAVAVGGYVAVAVAVQLCVRHNWCEPVADTVAGANFERDAVGHHLRRRLGKHLGHTIRCSDDVAVGQRVNNGRIGDGDALGVSEPLFRSGFAVGVAIGVIVGRCERDRGCLARVELYRVAVLVGDCIGDGDALGVSEPLRRSAVAVVVAVGVVFCVSIGVFVVCTAVAVVVAVYVANGSG